MVFNDISKKYINHFKEWKETPWSSFIFQSLNIYISDCFIFKEQNIFFKTYFYICYNKP